VDASFSAETLAGGTGAVIRDECGHFIAAATWFLPHVSSACSAETLAIRNGLYLASNQGCNKIVVESDCADAIEAVQNAGLHMGQDVAIIAECHQLEFEFGMTMFQHCHREVNEAADTLAKTAFSSRTSAVWDDNAPDFISSYIVNDATVI
jgi:ribonuclease HI